MDTNTQITRSFSDMASVTYPADTSLKMTFFQAHSLTVPDFLIKSLCLVGFLSVAYHVKDVAKFAWTATSSVFRRIAHVFRKRPEEGTAVIYGATNKIGRAFALKFAEDGLNLVLIDYSEERLAKLKEKLIKLNEDLEENVTCCVLGRATSLKEMQNDSSLKDIYHTLKKHKQIAYFVNCRNVKQKEIELFHQQKSSHIILTTYYNMTVYAALLRKTLKIMSESRDGRVICLNTTYGQEHILKKTHPLFFASSHFASTLAQTLKLTYQDFGIKFLNVHNNYRNVASGNKYSELVEYTLQNIGLSDDIYI